MERWDGTSTAGVRKGSEAASLQDSPCNPHSCYSFRGGFPLPN